MCYLKLDHNNTVVKSKRLLVFFKTKFLLYDCLIAVICLFLAKLWICRLDQDDQTSDAQEQANTYLTSNNNKPFTSNKRQKWKKIVPERNIRTHKDLIWFFFETICFPLDTLINKLDYLFSMYFYQLEALDQCFSTSVPRESGVPLTFFRFADKCPRIWKSMLIEIFSNFFFI